MMGTPEYVQWDLYFSALADDGALVKFNHKKALPESVKTPRGKPRGTLRIFRRQNIGWIKSIGTVFWLDSG